MQVRELDLRAVHASEYLGRTYASRNPRETGVDQAHYAGVNTSQIHQIDEQRNVPAGFSGFWVDYSASVRLCQEEEGITH
jgi:hypothetical protein